MSNNDKAKLIESESAALKSLINNTEGSKDGQKEPAAGPVPISTLKADLSAKLLGNVKFNSNEKILGSETARDAKQMDVCL